MSLTVIPTCNDGSPPATPTSSSVLPSGSVKNASGNCTDPASNVSRSMSVAPTCSAWASTPSRSGTTRVRRRYPRRRRCRPPRWRRRVDAEELEQAGADGVADHVWRLERAVVARPAARAPRSRSAAFPRLAGHDPDVERRLRERERGRSCRVEPVDAARVPEHSARRRASSRQREARRVPERAEAEARCRPGSALEHAAVGSEQLDRGVDGGLHALASSVEPGRVDPSNPNP